MYTSTDRQIDLNADMGESFGVYNYGADQALLTLITSANIACGFHAGDPTTMDHAVAAAVKHGVRIGAHIGLPDRLGFGRRHIDISPEDAYTYTLYQIGALDSFVRGHQTRMTHVKPHGALYMNACADRRIADAIAEAVRRHDDTLVVYALPGSELAAAAHARGLPVYPEFFADRPYVNGAVQMFGWTYDDIGGPQGAATRTATMLTDPAYRDVRTVCVHSDTHDAASITSAVREALASAGVLQEPLAPATTR